jgi:hypothetical protein
VFKAVRTKVVEFNRGDGKTNDWKAIEIRRIPENI